MAFVPEWEQLSEALERVMASTGLSSQEVQRDICRALADQKIKVRPRYAEPVTEEIIDHHFNRRFADEYGRFGRRFLTLPLEMGWRIAISDLDWNESRLRRQFQPGQEGYPGPPRDWHIWIELSSADVTSVLCNNRTSETKRSSAKSRGINDAIDHLWPHGIPSGLGAKDRDRAIIDWMKEADHSIPTNPARTIQRVLRARNLR